MTTTHQPYRCAWVDLSKSDYDAYHAVFFKVVVAKIMLHPSLFPAVVCRV
ncbi:hypothetical protein [Thiothrix unzii]|uniref:Uncharacterized protein n=1 Tax=Thiothrix unzii TaxID=111769 RepID=A0A975FAP5_9GAMM|nr:hypothetical protein [Thiothrix unzii]QTR54121.1 hypothetical protein J9260_03230 [Thiothrix unzii]